jgi:hypothetical protein
VLWGSPLENSNYWRLNVRYGRIIERVETFKLFGVVLCSDFVEPSRIMYFNEISQRYFIVYQLDRIGDKYIVHLFAQFLEHACLVWHCIVD